jgi:hypothetical protein
LARLAWIDSQTTTAAAYAGGISRADKESNRSDTDRVKPAFRRGMHDNHGALGTDGLMVR